MKFPSDDSDGQSSGGRRTLKLIAAGLGMLVITGLIPIFAPALMQGALAIPTVVILIAVTIALVVNIVPDPPQQAAAAASEKRKREMAGADIYSLIDRLVDDLNDDELAYLRKRLEGREQEHDHELSHSLEALLDERSETRQR